MGTPSVSAPIVSNPEIATSIVGKFFLAAIVCGFHVPFLPFIVTHQNSLRIANASKNVHQNLVLGNLSTHARSLTGCFEPNI